MNQQHRNRKSILPVVLILLTIGCNLPVIGASTPIPETSTFTPTTLPASATPLPTDTVPAATDTPIPLPTSTDTPFPPPFTATFVLPTLAPPTAFPTNTVVRTPTPFKPYGKSRFEGTFNGGTLVFRIGENGNTVIPKEVRLRHAACKENKPISDSITFDPPPSYPIVNNKFIINYLEMVFIEGTFTSPTAAQGFIRVITSVSGSRCTIGAIPWQAEAEGF